MSDVYVIRGSNAVSCIELRKQYNAPDDVCFSFTLAGPCDACKAELAAAGRTSIAKLEKYLLLGAKRCVCLLTKLEPNWDSYGAPPPNDRAVANTIRVLDMLQPYELSMARVLPSAEGGIGICFVQGDRYADIECSNAGEVVGVRYVGASMPMVIETDGTSASIEAGLELIRNHFSA